MRLKLYFFAIAALAAACLVPACSAPQDEADAGSGPPDQTPVFSCPDGAEFTNIVATIADDPPGVATTVDLRFLLCGLPVTVTADVDNSGATSACVNVPFLGEQCSHPQL